MNIKVAAFTVSEKSSNTNYIWVLQFNYIGYKQKNVYDYQAM